MSPDRSTFPDAPGPVVDRLRSLFRRRPPSVIFDIGSCEGEDAVRYARAFPMATIYAAEPLQQNLLRIRDNIESRRLANVVIIPTAFSDAIGSAQLHVSSGRPPGVPADEDWDYGNKSSSLLEPDQHLEVHPWISFDRVETVPTDTLESFCAANGISEIDFIHLDVQGAELLVLRGAGDLIDRTRVIWLEVEAIPLYAGQPLRNDVEAFMASHGFTKLVDTVGRISGDQLHVRRGQVDLTLREAITSAALYRRVRRLSRSARRRLRFVKPPDPGASASARRRR